MTVQEFDYLCKVLQECCAIALDPGKEYLVESRLTPLVRQLNLNSIGELVGLLRTRPSSGLYAQLVEALVTTETSFFRDQSPFEALRKVVIPELIRCKSRARSASKGEGRPC